MQGQLFSTDFLLRSIQETETWKGIPDADYILSTFPIVREQDIKAHGTFRSRDLIMGYLTRIRAGSLTHESLA